MNHKMECDFTSVINNLENNSFFIYGAGFVGDFFYDLLRCKGLQNHVKAFVMSKPNENEHEGVPVISINDVPDEKAYIVIAVHESVLTEIEEQLDKRKLGNRTWIYPYLYRLWLGKPIQTSIRVPVKQIWNQERNRYAIAVRYLAIDQYFQKNSVGYDLYRKSMGLPKYKSTVEKRLGGFQNLIEDWGQNGYRDHNAIRILDDDTVVDGKHRLTTAIYFGEKDIVCDIFSAHNKEPIEMIPDAKKMIVDNLPALGFTENDIQLLDETIKLIDAKI
ncbi:MAG: hypothetical protein E7297_04320 [Lachnospiraceae bacterium]|nr:hypothetical protein [Lachnospiraceae bacterium]